MDMLCMLFMDICPDLQMNNSRDVSFHLKLSDNISVLQFNCSITNCFCKRPTDWTFNKIEIINKKTNRGKEGLGKDKKDVKHMESWRKGTLKREEEPQNSSQPERPKSKSRATLQAHQLTQSFPLSLPKASHWSLWAGNKVVLYLQHLHSCAAVPSVTTKIRFLLPPVPTASSPARAPSLHPGPHKPPQSKALLRAGWPWGSGLGQPSLLPWGKPDAALSAQTQKESKHISPSTRNTWILYQPDLLSSAALRQTPSFQRRRWKAWNMVFTSRCCCCPSPHSMRAGAGPGVPCYLHSPWAAAPQDGLPAPRLFRKTSLQP